MRRRCSFYRSKPKTVPARCRTMVLGHSFVARLGTYINRKVHDKIDTNLGFDDTMLDVHLYGVGGRTVTKIRELDMGHVESFQPHTVHLEIGTNELSSDNANPTSVAEQVCSLVRELHYNYGVLFISVGHVVLRNESRMRGGLNGGALERFNRRVIEYNIELDRRLSSLSYAMYWRHRSVWRSPIGTKLEDGLHFNDHGNLRLYKSIKSAVIYGQKWNPYRCTTMG